MNGRHEDVDVRGGDGGADPAEARWAAAAQSGRDRVAEQLPPALQRQATKYYLAIYLYHCLKVGDGIGTVFFYPKEPEPLEIRIWIRLQPYKIRFFFNFSYLKLVIEITDFWTLQVD